MTTPAAAPPTGGPAPRTDTDVLRLRADAYYVPVPDGVWIRTTEGSFTLRGTTVGPWLERLAPLLDDGLVPDELYEALRPEQVGFVRGLLGALESRRVVRRERADAHGPGSAADDLFAQQLEFLRHRTADAAAALRRVQHLPVTVTGPAARADILAAVLLESGFTEVALRDADLGEEVADLVADCARRGHRVRVRPHHDPGDGPLVGVFAAGEPADALLDEAARTGRACWAALVEGQAMLVKGQVPGVASACVRCAWRRLAHSATGIPALPGTGHVPVATAAAILAQEMFRHVALDDPEPLGEGVVVDLTRLSIWRTAVDPDPTCPGHPRTVTAARAGSFPEAVFGARCFGPLTAAGPEDLPQHPLSALRLRLNVPGRDAPIATGTGPVVVSTTVSEARDEAVLLAVEATLRAPVAAPRDLLAVGTGRTAEAALRRAVRQAAPRAGWVAAAVPGEERAALARDAAELGVPLPEVTLGRHPSGLWAAQAAGRSEIGLAAAEACRRAVLAALGRDQVAGAGAADGVVAALPDDGADDGASDPSAVASALGLAARPLELPALVAAHLVAIGLGAAR